MAHKCIEAPPEAWGHSKWLRTRLLDLITASRALGLSAAELAHATGLPLQTVGWKLDLLVSLHEVEAVERRPGGPGRAGEIRYVALQVAGGSLKECRP